MREISTSLIGVATAESNHHPLDLGTSEEGRNSDTWLGVGDGAAFLEG